LSFIEPSFEIDTKGRVICQAHSSYPFFVMPGKTHYQEVQMEKILTCKTCKHYQVDECFFPKSEIDKIEEDRAERVSFKCVLCGNKIDRMLTIIQMLYIKQRKGIDLPLLCCICHETLKKKNFEEYYEKRLFIAVFLDLVIILGLIVSIVTMPPPYDIINSILFPVSIIMFKQILKKGFQLNLSVRDIRKGKKFYDKFFKS
jgi:hypothetical protein